MNTNIDLAALLLRLSLGAMFIAHGLLKVLVFTMPGTVAFFESQGFPGFGALYVHVGAGWLFTNANGGWEYPAFLVMATIVQALLGAGRFRLTLPTLLRPKLAET